MSGDYLGFAAMNLRTALFFTVFFSHSLIAEERKVELPGFFGIGWGTGSDEAKKAFDSRSHARFDRSKSAPHQLSFEGGKFAGFKLRGLKLMFEAGSFWGTEFFIESPSKNHEKEFSALKAMLTEKYGKPSRDEMVGDGFEANWYFPVPQLPAHNIWIIQNPKGEGVKVLYVSEATKKTVAQGAGPKVVKPLKPSANSVKAGDKEDL